MFAPFTSFLKCEMYTQYKSLVRSADQLLREIVQNEASGQAPSGLFSTSKSYYG